MYKTIREAIEGGAYGAFTTALYNFLKDPTFDSFMYAYQKGDLSNRSKLHKVMPNIDMPALLDLKLQGKQLSYVAEVLRLPSGSELSREFPWLIWLDVPTTNPYVLEQPRLIETKVILHNPQPEERGDEWKDGEEGVVSSAFFPPCPGFTHIYVQILRDGELTPGSYGVLHNQIELQVDEKPQG